MMDSSRVVVEWVFYSGFNLVNGRLYMNSIVMNVSSGSSFLYIVNSICWVICIVCCWVCLIRMLKFISVLVVNVMKVFCWNRLWKKWIFISMNSSVYNDSSS